MKLLVTGSLGLVGSSCVKHFSDSGWDVVGIDNNMRSDLFGTRKQEGAIRLDIRDEGAVNDLFAHEKFDAVIHAAAQPSHDWSAKNPMMDFHINTVGTLNLLEATRQYCPNAIFVFVSTDKVYGENMSCPVIEKSTRYESQYLQVAELAVGKISQGGFVETLGLDFAGCRSPFGCSKAAADIYVQEYGNYYGMKTACFRPGCITGRNHQGAELHGFLAYVAKCIREEKTYHIFGNGKNVRDQIHADDLARAFHEFIQEPKTAAVYNIGGGPERTVSVLEAIALCEEAIGKKAIVEFAEPRKGDRLYDVHNVSKFCADYPNWDYRYSLQDIIQDVCGV